MSMRQRLSLSRLAQLIAEIEPLKQGFDNLSFPAIITDRDAVILYTNRAVEKQTGFSAQESIGKNPADLWGGHMDKEFYTKMWDTILNQKLPFVGEMKNHHKDGREYWQEIQISPVIHKNGEVLFFIGIEPDISDRKERERFREEFISLLAHQLRNPLTSIRWSLSLLLDKGGLTPDQQKILEEVYHDDRLLIDLIADFLVITRVGSAKPNQETIDLVTVIEEIVKQIKETYPQVTIDFNTNGKYLFQTNTKQLITQVFSNLIINAAKYCDDQNGKVTISLKHGDSGYVLSVENNGPLIPQDEHINIFTKLYRGNNATDRNKAGTGLGLYIVKLICDNFDWTVTFESPKKGGNTTVFTIIMPVKSSEKLSQT